MHRPISVLVLASATLVSGCHADRPGVVRPVEPAAQSATPPATDAPPAEPPAPTEPAVTLDGTIAADEWAAGEPLDPAPAFPLHVLRGSSLYVGVEAGQGFPHVCLFDGERVRILHASASLGTAVYEREGEGWRRTEAFDWVARDADEAVARDEQRAENLTQRGWAATTMGMGEPGHTELQIDLDPATTAKVRWAVTVFGATGATVWPPTVSDGCADTKLLMGEPPEQAQFDPSTWAALPV